VGRSALDGTASEVACSADDQGEALAVWIGDGSEAVPVSISQGMSLNRE
jgi:hypothetical protein